MAVENETIICGCGNQTEGHTCNVCEYEWQHTAGGDKPARLCSDCAPPCVSCQEPVCEYHSRANGECTACSGPTDAELRAMYPY